MSVHDPCADPLDPATRLLVDAAADRVITDMYRLPTRREQVSPTPTPKPARPIKKRVWPRKSVRTKAEIEAEFDARDAKIAKLERQGVESAAIAERLGITMAQLAASRRRARRRGVAK